MKTSELTGQALDWAVASIEKLPSDLLAWKDGLPVVQRTCLGHTDLLRCEFSTNWAQGGPIIDREGIDLYCNIPTNPAHKDPCWQGDWRACYHRCGYGTDRVHGKTALIAAMRCFVANRLGDEVEVPAELLT